jgi:hypothetical protein
MVRELHRINAAAKLLYYFLTAFPGANNIAADDRDVTEARAGG